MSLLKIIFKSIIKASYEECALELICVPTKQKQQFSLWSFPCFSKVPKVSLLNSLSNRETKFIFVSISNRTSSPLKLFFQTLSHFAYKDKFSMKDCFSKPLLLKNWIFSSKTNCLGSVRVAKDPPTLGGSSMVPFSKNKHATLLHFCDLSICSLAIENS